MFKTLKTNPKLIYSTFEMVLQNGVGSGGKHCYAVKLMFLERKYADLTLKKNRKLIKKNKVISKNVLKIYFRNFSTVHSTR